MARFETRQFGSKKHFLVIAETPEESAIIDAVLGTREPIRAEAEVVQSDGQSDHYIRLSKKTNDA